MFFYLFMFLFSIATLWNNLAYVQLDYQAAFTLLRVLVNILVLFVENKYYPNLMYLYNIISGLIPILKYITSSPF